MGDSRLSLWSEDSLLSIGSLLSSMSCGAVMSHASAGTVMGEERPNAARIAAGALAVTAVALLILSRRR